MDLLSTYKVETKKDNQTLTVTDETYEKLEKAKIFTLGKPSGFGGHVINTKPRKKREKKKRIVAEFNPLGTSTLAKMVNSTEAKIGRPSKSKERGG